MELIFYPAARTAVQAAWGWLVAHLAILSWLPADTVVDLVLTGLVTGGYVAGVRWLETRKGAGWWPVLARAAARVLMLGLRKQPTYTPQRPTVGGD